MQVELLVVPGCPHETPTARRLRRVLDDAGLAETPVEVRRITADAVAGYPEFAGSPTILLDGIDPFPDRPAGTGALSCRLYRTGSGLSGVPSLEQLRRALT